MKTYKVEFDTGSHHESYTFINPYDANTEYHKHIYRRELMYLRLREYDGSRLIRTIIEIDNTK